MHILEEINEIERGLSANGETLLAFCKRAGVNISTWNRWKAGSHSPNLATWSRVKDAAADRGRAV